MSELQKKVLKTQHFSHRSEWYQAMAQPITFASGSRSSGQLFSSASSTEQTKPKKKIERKLLEFLSEFKRGTITTTDGVNNIMRIFKKYGTSSEIGNVEKISTYSSKTKSKSKSASKSVPKPGSSTPKKKSSKSNISNNELARLFDSDGFVSTPPKRLKRIPKAVDRFDETKLNVSRTLRSSRIRTILSGDGTSSKKNTGNIQHEKVNKVSQSFFEGRANISQTSTPKSILGERVHFEMTVKY